MISYWGKIMSTDGKWRQMTRPYREQDKAP